MTTPPPESLSTPPSPTMTGHHDVIHQIISPEQNKHIDTLRAISNLPIHNPDPRSRLTNFDRFRTQQDLLLAEQPELAMRELDSLSKKLDVAVTQARTRERDRLQKKSNFTTSLDPNSIDYTKVDRKVIRHTLNQVKEIHPLLSSVLNKKVANKITSTYQHSSDAQLKTIPSITFQSKVEAELEKNWSTYFPEVDKRREVSTVITDSIAAEAGNPHPERLPTEQLGRLLRDAVNNYSSHNTNVNEELLFQESQLSAQELSLDAVIFQNHHRPSDAQEARRRFAATDPFYALKQNKSPLASAKSGIFRSFVRGRMVNKLVNSLDDNEINQRINSQDLSLAQKRALIRAQIYEGVYLWEAGVDANRLNNMHSHISSISTRLGSIEHDSYQLNNLASLRDKRAYLAEVMQKNPKAVSRYLSIFANTNHTFKNVSNLDRSGWRFKAPYLMHTFRDKKEAIIEPLASIIYRPFVAFDDFTYKYNPISWTQRKVGGKILSVRRHVGLALARKATTLAAKQGVRGLAGKLLLKTGLAIAGVGTGGLGTLIAILSIAKDIINIIGLKKLLKRLGKILATGLYLIWSLIKALMSLASGALAGTLVGAGIGFLIGGPVGAVIGGAVGGSIGGYMVVAGISVTAALTAAWAAITGAVTTAATVVAGYLSAITTSSIAYLSTLTVSSFFLGFGSIALGTMVTQTQQAEINTLRVSQGPIVSCANIPQDECIKLQGFSCKESETMIEAINILKGESCYYNKICVNGPINLIRSDDCTYGGITVSNNQIKICSAALSSLGAAIYTLAHESGHIFGRLYSGGYKTYKELGLPFNDGGCLPSYPMYDNGGSALTCTHGEGEDMAETIGIKISGPYSPSNNILASYPIHQQFAIWVMSCN